MEVKKRKWVFVVLALLLLLIGGVGGVFISNYFGDKVKTSETNTEEKTEENIENDKEAITEEENNETIEDDSEAIKGEDYDIEKAQKLVYKYYRDGLINNLCIDCEAFDQSYDIEKEILSVLTLYISEKDWKKIACNKVAKKGKPGSGKESYYLLDDFYECTGKSISYEFMNEKYKELYGSNKDLPKKSGGISIITEEGIGSISAYLDYNEANNIFVLGSFMGDANGPYENHYYSMVKSAKLQEDKLIVSLAYLALLNYDVVDGPPVYQIGKEKIEQNDKRIKGLTNEQIMKKYQNKLDTFEFVFVKEGERYILVSAK